MTHLVEGDGIDVPGETGHEEFFELGALFREDEPAFFALGEDGGCGLVGAFHAAVEDAGAVCEFEFDDRFGVAVAHAAGFADGDAAGLLADGFEYGASSGGQTAGGGPDFNAFDVCHGGSAFRFVLVEDLRQALAVELAVDASVDGEDGGEGAAAEAGHGLNGEKAVFGGLAVVDAEFGGDPGADLRGALDVAGGAVADAELVLAGFGAFELGVEREDAFDFRGRDAEVFRRRQDAVVRDVPFAGLDELDD